MLGTYRAAYQEMLARIADRIVAVAEESPIEPSPAGDVSALGESEPPTSRSASEASRDQHFDQGQDGQS